MDTEELSAFDDAPISSIAEDKLGRKAFCEAIVRSATSVSKGSSIVVAVQGPWGSGKTSALKVFEDMLCAEEWKSKCTVVQFNPWLFSGHEDLAFQFFKHLSAGLRLYDSTKTGKAISRGLLALGTLVSTCASVETITSGGTGVLKYLAKGVDRLSEQFDEAVRIESLSAMQWREDLSEKLEKYRTRICVVIDDIDRLDAQETKELFKLVKNCANLPNLSFVLAFDPEVVSRILTERADVDGVAFIEKIVQVPLDLPVVDPAALEKMLIDGLNGVFSLKPEPEGSLDKNRWFALLTDGLKRLCRTPRDVKRYVNGVQSSWMQTAPEEIDVVDLLAIEAIRVFSPGVYRAVECNEELFTRIPSGSMYEVDMEFTERCGTVERIVNLASDRIRPAVNEILKQLFPAVRPGAECYAMGHTDEGRAFAERRMCSRRVFHKYFSHAVFGNQVSFREIDKFVEPAIGLDVRLALLSEWHAKKILSDSLRILCEGLKSSPDASREGVLEALLVGADSAEYTALAIFPVPVFRMLVDTACDDVLPLIEQPARMDLLARLIRDDRSLAAVGDIIFSKREKLADVITEDMRTQLGPLCAQAVARLAAVGRLASMVHVSQLLDHWRIWNDTVEVEQWCRWVLSDKEQLPKVLSSYLNCSWGQSLGSYIAEQRWMFNTKHLAQHFVMDDLWDAVVKLDRDSLDERLKQAIGQEGWWDPRPILASKR